MLYKNYVLLKVHILGDIRGNYTEEILIKDCNIFNLENVNQYKELTENLVADMCIFSEEYSVYDTNLGEEIGCFCEIELEDLLEKIEKQVLTKNIMYVIINISNKEGVYNMKFEEFLIKLRNGETFENIAKDTMVECMGNLAFEDCDLYEFLGNMGADIKSFDMAKEVLEKNAKKISNGRNKGILQEISALIDMDRQQILSINAKLETNKELAEKISRLNDDVSILKEKQTETAEKLSLCAKYENKLRYEQYKDDVKSIENALNESLSFFPDNKLPENETVENLDSLSSMYTTIESNIKNNSASKAEIDDYIRKVYKVTIQAKQFLKSKIT